MEVLFVQTLNFLLYFIEKPLKSRPNVVWITDPENIVSLRVLVALLALEIIMLAVSPCFQSNVRLSY